MDLNGEKEEISLFSIALTEELDKNILFISEDKYKGKGYFDQLLNAEKIDLSELKSKNLNQYSLLIFDGIPLKKLDEDISKKIVDGYNEDNFGLFFISEAKEIGKVDDNPIIESILPIELNPKSLKQDPKVAILLLLDVSSSMMGEKLSIAKVSASQMLVNLKPEDLVSIYLFWDQFEKLFNFMPVKEVSTFFSFDKIEATGGTDLAPCLEKGLKDLLRVSSANRHVVIISDFQTKPASWDNILSYAVENDITISVIQIGTDINSSLAEKIAKVTGGNIYSANSFNAIPTILFEDRKRIARPPFLKQNYTIFDSYKDAIAQISGMNITTSKEKSNVILKNQYDDPLFAFIKKGSKGVAVFLSDSKGIYTKNLFNKNYVKLIFNKYIESQISNLINKVSVIETASGFSVLINSPDLYQPEGILFFNQEKVCQYQLNKLTSGYFSFSISTIDSGLYTLQIKDMGNTMLKIPVYFNGKSVSNNYSSIIYAYNNKKMTFRKYYSANLWLILFFLSSILTTYFLRIFKK
ncbi:MAG: VWA domain-containing protein [Spirochaetota bacterium]